jgi:hypothetical protein
VREHTVGFLQQIWDEVGFVGVMESCDRKLEFLRQLDNASLVSTQCCTVVINLTRMKPSKSVAS